MRWPRRRRWLRHDRYLDCAVVGCTFPMRAMVHSTSGHAVAGVCDEHRVELADADGLLKPLVGWTLTAAIDEPRQLWPPGSRPAEAIVAKHAARRERERLALLRARMGTGTTARWKP